MSHPDVGGGPGGHEPPVVEGGERGGMSHPNVAGRSLIHHHD